MKKIIATISIALLLNAISHAQQVIRLYEGKAPGSESWVQRESEFTHPMLTGKLVRNVTNPTLTVFKPRKPNGTAVIVCPGGGFHWLSWQSEGTDVAEWLRANGITVFVLKYRLINTGSSLANFDKAFQALMSMMTVSKKTAADSIKPEMPEEIMKIIGMAIADGMQAIKYVKQHAAEYSLDTNKVGVIGFSAGTTIAQSTAISGEPSVTPNFAGIIYGGQPLAQKITDNAPPLFIVSAADDMVSSSNPDLFKQWQEAGKSAELHVYSKGGHGFGMKKQGLPVDTWIERFGDWLKLQDFIK